MKISFALLLLTLVAAPLMSADAQQPPRAEPSGVAVDVNYIISSQDVIHVAVFQEEELTRTVRLSEDGTVSLPLIGGVRLEGLNVQQAAKRIEDLYRADYLVSPQVTLTLAEFSRRSVVLMGQVNKPGIVEIPANKEVNLIEVIAMAGGYTRIANPARITVKRKEGTQEKIYQLNARDMARDGRTPAFTIRPGDTITVAESMF